MRLNGSYIGTTPAPSTLAAPGIWTLDEAARYRAASSWPSAVPPMSVTANLAMWLKADAGVLDGSGAAITVDNTAVATWQDQSGNGRDATQSTSGSRPVLRTAANGKNNLPVVYFGGSQSLSMTNIQSNSMLTVFMVLYQSANRMLLGGASDSTFVGTSVGNQILVRNSGDGGATISSAGTDAVWAYVCVNRGGTGTNQVSVRVNGVEKGLSTTSGTINLGSVAKRSTAGGQFGTGYFGEILVYSSSLSSIDVGAVENYLSFKWGI